MMQIASRVLLFLLFALALWGFRAAYIGYVIAALSWMIVQNGVELHQPKCEWPITLDGAALSMTKFGHILLFGLFFVITVRQFRRFDRPAVLLSILATLVMGLLVELIEGATGAGNCRMRDLVPDVAGALIAAAFVGLLVAGRRGLTSFD
jgi:hypothetical protein